MERRELRIGNLVTDEFWDSFKKVIIVESINDKGINLSIENSDDFPEMQSHWIEPYYTFDQLRGIPLTQEWLIKFGFNPRLDTLFMKFFFTISKERDGFKLWITDGTYGTTFKYVHQLQNLFHALTGEELTLPD